MHLPLNFGDRPCDRTLAALLARDGTPPAAIRWQMFLVWRDYASARDDRRVVPEDAAARRACLPVVILAEYLGWRGAAGDFVEAAIRAGFFLLTPHSTGQMDLVLVEFFPANRENVKAMSMAKLGGIGKSLVSARRAAELASKEQMEFFSRRAPELLAQYGRTEVREAAGLVTQLCRIAQFPTPAAAEWQATLIAKAVPILKEFPEGELQFAFKWLVANRGSQELPPRLDILLDRFAEFVEKGRAAAR